MGEEERIKSFVQCCQMSDFFIKQEFFDYLYDNGFFNAPASTKYHGAYEGGLFDHSQAVFKRLFEITEHEGLEWQRRQSPFVVGMFHDLCKIDQYVTVLTPNPLDEQTGNRHEPYKSFIHNNNLLIKGHGAKSIMLLSQFITLSEEEMLCIRYHMGAYETDDWNEFDKAIKKCPNVLWTHTADMLASKCDDVQGVVL